MFLFERELELPIKQNQQDLLSYLEQALLLHIPEGQIPIRFAITETNSQSYRCEIGVLTNSEDCHQEPTSIFNFLHRGTENTERFNAVMLVPTGIGAEIGGHAGDAAPAARLLSAVCDTLITHPNVLNASDINEIPDNGLYVEGSVLCRLLMGTVGLQRVRANRILTIIHAHEDKIFVNFAINAVNAARSAYGLDCPRIIQLNQPVELVAEYSSSGSAVGRIEGLETLCEILDEYRNEYDAVAISSVIGVPPSFHMDYFLSEGAMVNPWGGVEAMLTHAISSLYNIPSAHSPMLESQDIANKDPGIVDSRMAAEAVSNAFLHCILKGLHRSPKIIADPLEMQHHSMLTAADISCLIIPDGCIGLPTLAALKQGIKVISVRENRNIMRNDLTSLPWAPGQLHIVENYWEAVGVMIAIKAGIAPESVRRPMTGAAIELRTLQSRTLVEIGGS